MEWHEKDTSLLTVGETKQSSGFQNICQRKSSFITNSFLFLFSALSNYVKQKQKGRCLTVSADFIGWVEPPVPARRRADVHVEMDVVSQPVAALLVPHKYRLLPVLRPFTLVVEKRKGKQPVQGRLMRKVAPFITAWEIDFHFSFPVMEWGRDGERWTLALCQTTVHSPAVTQTPGHYSGCPNVSEENRERLTCGL